MIQYWPSGGGRKFSYKKCLSDFMSMFSTQQKHVHFTQEVVEIICQHLPLYREDIDPSLLITG